LALQVLLGMGSWLGGARAGHSQTLPPARASAADSLRPVYPGQESRALVIYSGLLPARRITTKYNGVPLNDARSQPGSQMRIVGMLPVLVTKPVVLVAGASYLVERGSYNRNLYATASQDSAVSFKRQDISASLTAVHRSTLFHRPVTYMATVVGVSRDIDRLEKVTGGVTALMTLRSTARTRLSAGLSVQLNPSIKVPVSPVLTYWHRFGSSPWEVDAVLPSRVYVRRPLLAGKCWLSLGTDLTSTHSFGSGLIPGFSSTFETNTVTVQTGALFEYQPSKYFMLGLRGGLDQPVSMWVGEKNSSRETLKAEGNRAGYVGLVLSGLLPARKH
jgi:hypothetical protein